MRIIPICQSVYPKTNKNISFGSQYGNGEPIKLYCADEDTERYAEFLHNHMLSEIMPPEGLYSGRLEEYELNALMKKLVPPVVYKPKGTNLDLCKLHDYHIDKIDGMENSYKGPLMYSDISALKPFGLNVVQCRYLPNDMFIDHVDEIVDFIQNMKGDSVYLGCDCGTDRTNRALWLNYYLNPSLKATERVHAMVCHADYDDLIDFCDALQPHHKEAMGWTEDFAKEVREKLVKDREEIP